MKKEKDYHNTRFGPEVLAEADELFRAIAAREKLSVRFGQLTVKHDDATWDYDSLDEFLADYRKFQGFACITLRADNLLMTAWYRPEEALMTVITEAPSRKDVESIFEVFERWRSVSTLPSTPATALKPIIFVGHGRSAQWRELKDHLQDKHGFRIEAFEAGARAGHTIRDVLEDMVSKSSFALLVLTGEDEQADGILRARQNVIHEAGLFQGRLGFARAILVLEAEVEEFSNVQGIQYIRFSKDNIKESFGEVLATIRREFGPVG